MKTLTVKQPWASLIVNGVKDIENRTWRTKYRGRILIHVAANDFDFRKYAVSEEQRLFIQAIKKPYVHSAIIGSVEIVGCVRDYNSIWSEKDCYNWVLKNPRLFKDPVFGIKGRLSLWDFKTEDLY